MTAPVKKRLRTALKALINFSDRQLGLRQLMSEESRSARTLAGDRAVEWSWVVANLPPPPARILDLGCVESPLTAIAARLGHPVTAVDLRDIEYEMTDVHFFKGDVSELDFGDAKFDTVLNCSTIEHIGLPGRYGARDNAEGDLTTMWRLRNFLAPNGKMIITIPVGRDAVLAPWHRIYGDVRLPMLFRGYRIEQEEYWVKDASGLWKSAGRWCALAVEGNERFYALGLFVLVPEMDRG